MPFFRFSPSKVALGYIALSVLALALFALPLWYAYHANIGTFRAYVPGEDIQRLVQVFDKEGATGLAAAIDVLPSRPDGQIIVLADASKRKLAGNLPAWPAQVPDASGIYGLVIDTGAGSSLRVVASHLELPGGYRLLMGRESVRFESLVELFWYGIAGAVLIVLVMAAIMAWLIRRSLLSEVHQISRTASAIVNGDLSRRVATGSGSTELDTLARTVNEMLEQLAQQNVRLESEIAVRRQAEQALQRAHEELEELVAQRTAQLARANESLRRSEKFLAEAQRLSLTGSFGWSVASSELSWSDETYAMVGLDPAVKPTLDDVFRCIHPEDLALFQDTLSRAAREREDLDFEHRLLLKDGSVKHVHLRARLADKESEALEYVGAVTDVTALKRAEDVLAGEKHLLELLAKGHPLPQILESLCLLVERNADGCLCAIVLVDAYGTHLRHGAAPSLPPSYNASSDGLPIDPSSCPCATAVLQKQQVIVTDVASETRWSKSQWRERALAHGLRACWSSPIVSSTGSILGTFALHSLQPRSPTPHHQQLIEQFTHFASIAIEHKAAEEELRQSEAYLSQLFELAPDGVVLTDLSQHRILRVNREFTRMFGYTAEEAVGRNLRELIAPDELETVFAQNAASIASGRKVEMEVVRQRKNGTRLHVHFNAAPVKSGDGKNCAYLVYRDITERKAAQESLRRSEAFLAEGQRISRTGSWGWEVASGNLVWSEQQFRMLGFEPGSTEPSMSLLFTAIHPEDRSRVRRALEAATQERRNYAVDYRIVLADGSVRHMRSAGRPVVTETGSVDEYIGVTTDTTDRVHAEAALRRAQRLEATGTLAGGIAHDFNNILGAILGYGEMALRDTPKGSRLYRDLDSIISAGERGRALVDRILTFSRSGVGERFPVHVQKVVREALDLLEANLPEGIRVDATLRSHQAAMLGDPTQVHQVLMNLGTNAVQAMMPTGGTLSISLDAVHFDVARSATIGTIAVGDYIVLMVGDSGSGIAPDVLERIFDPFFTTKEVGVGTGLGLSLVHGIVTQVGGAIDVSSKLGEGSAFTVYLPRSGDAAESLDDEEPALPRGAGQRVLIVDDEEPLVRLATRTLEELGYAPAGFTSSAAALSAFRADPAHFDAVITDERMPGMSGSALIREVRSLRGTLPVLLVSGYVGGKVTAQAREAGADEVLKKPLLARELATSLARVLRA